MQIPFLKDAVKALSLSTALQQPILTNSPSQDSISIKDEIPDGPFSFCKESRSTDLLAIKSVSITKQPVYMYVAGHLVPCNLRAYSFTDS